MMDDLRKTNDGWMEDRKKNKNKRKNDAWIEDRNDRWVGQAAGER